MSQHDQLLTLRETLRRLIRGNQRSVYAPHFDAVETALRTGEEAGGVIRDAQACMRHNGHAIGGMA